MKKLADHQADAVTIAARELLGKFIYPTGTGKTLIEARIIGDHIKNNKGSVFAVLASRIMLAQQLFSEIWFDLAESHENCLFFSLHSGSKTTLSEVARKTFKKTDGRNKELEHTDLDIEDQDDELDVRTVKNLLRERGIDTDLNFRSGTKKSELLAAVADAEGRGIPLVICSTYHSSHVLENLENIDVLICDEAHNTVSLEFSSVHSLPAVKRFYFTATEKSTVSATGRGMQNEALFGKRLGCMSAATAVDRKLIVRPRIHYVTTSVAVGQGAEAAADARAIEECFEEHSRMIRFGAKLLVAVRGSSAMKKLLVGTNYFERLRGVRPNLTVFSILACKDEVRINGVVKTREEFMKRLQALTDADQALILHYDILSEGIDVPGITGVMPLRLLGTSKFLQMLGRATRLHVRDRASKAMPGDKNWHEYFVKPYAWLVLPHYGATADEQLSASEHYVKNLRDYDFIPGQDEYFSEAGGEKTPVPVETLFVNGKKPAELAFDGSIVQRIEDRKMAECYAIVQTMDSADLVDML